MSVREVLAAVVLLLVGLAAYWVGKLRGRKRELQAQALRRAVAALPGWQPQIMIMHCEDRYNYLEIAAKLEMPAQYVLAEMAKAYATLRMQELSIPERRRGRIRLFVLRHVIARM